MLSKSKASDNRKASDLTDKTENYIGLDSNKIKLLQKKYNCDDQEELVIKLQEKELYNEEFTEEEKIFYDNPEWEFIKSIAELGFILYREHQYGKSVAINELIEGYYQIHLDEHQNPFKELINFTLKYFDRFFVENPIEAEKLLKHSFPTMHLYIKRQISTQKSEITSRVPIDEQRAFDEFLIFCKNAFCSHYPDKTIRDERIKYNFKIFHNSLIQFIDAEEANL